METRDIIEVAILIAGMVLGAYVTLLISPPYSKIYKRAYERERSAHTDTQYYILNLWREMIKSYEATGIDCTGWKKLCDTYEKVILNRIDLPDFKAKEDSK